MRRLGCLAGCVIGGVEIRTVFVMIICRERERERERERGIMVAILYIIY